MRHTILALLFLLSVWLLHLSYSNNQVQAASKPPESAKIDYLIKKLENGSYKEEFAEVQRIANIIGHNAYYPNDLQRLARYHARDSLIKIGKPAVPSLVKLFGKEVKGKNSNVLCYVTEALGEIGDESAVPTLVDALKDKTTYDGERHEYCISNALAKLSRPGVGALLELIKDSSINQYARSDFVLALKKESRADSSVTSALIDILNNMNYRRYHNDYLIERIIDFVASSPETIDSKTAVPVLAKVLRQTDNAQSEKQINIILDRFGVSHFSRTPWYSLIGEAFLVLILIMVIMIFIVVVLNIRHKLAAK